jgi:serine protease inhibitor
MDTSLATGCASFGIAMLQKLLEQGGAAKNVFVSPASVFMALSMAWNGAAGPTRTEMAQVLGLQGSPQEVRKAERELRDSLESKDPKVRLRIANALYLSQKIPFKDEYLKNSRDIFLGDIASRDFARPETVQEINQWVSRQTEERIPKILDQLDADSLLVILNAVYFKGDWSIPFMPRITLKAPFTLTGGTRKTVQMMSNTDHWEYAEEKEGQAIRLPYGSGRYAFYVFLPSSLNGLPAFVKNFSSERLEMWRKSLRMNEVWLQMPRFELQDDHDLERVLPDMGMPKAYTNQADFSGISSYPLKISRVKHKTFLKVDEQGTEAAAATAVTLVAGAAFSPKKIIEMRVDHPFLCLIRDDETGLVLFIGVIENPSEP